MNGLRKPIKNPIQKIKKTIKIKVELPQVNEKPLTRKRIFVQTLFSHSTLKLDRKNFTPQNHSPFRSFLFRRDQNDYSNLNSNHEHSRQIARIAAKE